MKLRLLLFLCLILLIYLPISAQEIQQLPVESGSASPYYASLLNSSNQEISADNALNEQILDLVEVYLTDSILPIKRQRHRVVGAALLPMFGYKWLTINYRKEKFVATATSNLRVPREGSDLFTEYDVNWNLTSVIPRYQKLEEQGYMRMKEIGRKGKKHNGYEGEPFVEINENSNLERYHLHCEHTPLIDYRPMINQLFLPVISPMNTDKHPNFRDMRPSIGLYGAFVSDCNHHCHPEIHPYEWIWWMNLSDSVSNGKNGKEWLIGLLREGSNRFPKWSPAPRIGEISVPFAFPADKNELIIQIDHLVFGPFDEAGLGQLNIPESAFDLDFETLSFGFDHPKLNNKTLRIETSNPMPAKGLKAWIGELKHDEAKGIITGNIHFAASVKDLWTARLKTRF